MEPFSCCGHWNICNMGRETCYWEKEWPERMNACKCYKRNHVIVKDDLPPTPAPNKVEEEEKTVELEQLSLF